jgi:hypothetical protein
VNRNIEAADLLAADGRDMVTPPIPTPLVAARAHASGPAAEALPIIVETLRQQLGANPATAVLYFASTCYDPKDLAEPVATAFPDAAVIGCSTAGEFTDDVTGTGGISALALPHGLLTGALAALGDLSTDVAAGTHSAVCEIEDTLQVHLRDLDPATHFGLVLIDGVNRAEEAVNEVIGNAAPLLDVVGGSAGDDLNFQRTWVVVGTKISYQGMALMICRAEVPFHVVKTCSFVPIGRTLRITDADIESRIVRSFDGRPAVEAYAEAVGVSVEELNGSIWMRHPLGLMIDGQPWIRSPQAVTPQGHIVFYAQIPPDMEVEVMQGTDLVTDTQEAIAEARLTLGGQTSGAVIFNCVLRRLEIDANGNSEAFLHTFGDLPLAGFHTYGETWIGHINQTLTGVIFG